MSGDTLRFAVVDDDADLGAGLADWFDAAGYACAAFTDVASAQAAGLTTFDGFIVDLDLGRGRNSMALLEEIRRCKPEAVVVVFTGKVSTGDDADVLVDRTLRDLGVKVMEKPVRPATLLALLVKA